jgi:hypothetical protein
MNTLIPYPRRLLLFAVLSLGDLLLTCYLLQLGEGQVYESNPIAEWWLSRFGWAGLAGFKVGAVLVVAGLAAVVSLRQCRNGGRILSFACSTLAVVLVYSCAVAGAIDPEVADDLPRAEAKARQLDRIVVQGRQYQAALEQLGQDLVHGRRPLAQAVALLARTDKGRSRDWQQLLGQFYPGYSGRQCLAINLLKTAVHSVKDRSASRRLTHRLEADFEAVFGRRLPERWTERTDMRLPPHA